LGLLLVVVALATACGARTPLELVNVTDAEADDGAQDACACVEAEVDASTVDVTLADVSPVVDSSLDAGSDSSSIDAAAEAATICVPATCATLGTAGYSCGFAADGCGGLLQCGGCVAPQCCGGGGFDVCGGTGGCEPRTCAEQGLDCGPTGDGCGGLLQCGICVAPQTCGGGGIMGRCGAPDAGCHPLTCQDQNIDCGVAGDGCGFRVDVRRLYGTGHVRRRGSPGPLRRAPRPVLRSDWVRGAAHRLRAGGGWLRGSGPLRELRASADVRGRGVREVRVGGPFIAARRPSYAAPDMSASDEWTEYHLTPNGWVVGTDKTDFGATEVVARPSDAVLTVTFREQFNGYGPPLRTFREDWRSKDERRIEALVTRFGSKPPGVKT
jgi:hypothetical protein